MLPVLTRKRRRKRCGTPLHAPHLTDHLTGRRNAQNGTTRHLPQHAVCPKAPCRGVHRPWTLAVS
eukprot:2365946-Alexandrium_andersonii.AAC.1